jgi:tRNA (uracil-5-)-methyltransferase TRM9
MSASCTYATTQENTMDHDKDLSVSSTPYFTEKDNVVGVYNEIAHHFKDTRAYTWCWIEDFMRLFEGTNTLIYDIGCGSGRNLRSNLNMIGVDNCDSFLDICRQEDKKVVKGCMTDIPLESGSASALICIAAFHHLSTRGRRIKALLEMKRVSKPRSLILLSVWSIRQPKKTRREFTYGDNIVPWNKDGVIYDRYYYIFKLAEIEELFEMAGLRVIEYKWDCGNEIYILET